MSSYHQSTNPPYMIYGASLDPIASPSYFPFDEPGHMAHSQSGHSYGSSPGSCRDSYLDNRYMQATAAAGASPTFSAPLPYEDNSIYTSTYDDQSPVRAPSIDPRDLGYTLGDHWMFDSESSQGSSFSGTNATTPSSYESQSSLDRSTGEKSGYPCTVPGCESESRFSRKTDLNRHIQSVHGSKKFDCTFKWCGRHGVHGFSRSDHLREHLREVHKKDIPKIGKGRSKQC